MADALLGLVAHPLAVVANILGQTLRALPVLGEVILVFARLRVNRRLASELRRDLDHRLVDQHRDGVQVTGVSSRVRAAAPRAAAAAAGEGVVEGGKPLSVEQIR